jgi:hypothetical protein
LRLLAVRLEDVVQPRNGNLQVRHRERKGATVFPFLGYRVWSLDFWLTPDRAGRSDCSHGRPSRLSAVILAKRKD